MTTTEKEKISAVPEDDEEKLIAVRCRGCGRTIGWARGEGALRHSVFCDTWCATMPPITEQEVRNDAWRIANAFGRSRIDIAREAGVAHSLVYKTLWRG